MRRKILIHVLVVFFFLGVIFAAYPELFFHFSSKIPGGGNLDAQLHLSIIDWTFSSRLPGFYHLPVYYPLAYTRAANPPLFVQSAVFKVLSGLGLNTESCNNLYIVLAWVLGAYGCFLLCREFTSGFFFPLAFSSIFIIHQINFLFINWLNFMSLYFFPFILFCFVRYMKTKKEIYAVSTAALLVVQLMASLFYGFFAWAFFLPLLLLASFVMGRFAFPEIKTWLVYLFSGIIIILFIFLPYLNSQSGLRGDSGFQVAPADLITGESLFYYSKIWDFFFEKNPEVGIYYFPGFIFTFFIMSYAVSFVERKRWKYGLLTGLFLLCIGISLFVYINHAVLDYLFLFLLIAVISLFALNWGKIPWMEKVFILALFLYFCIFVYFHHIPGLRAFSAYSSIQQTIPVLGTGLRKAKRILFMLAPFMTVFAAAGAVRLFRHRPGKEVKKAAVAGLIFLLMFLENIRPDRRQAMMQPLPAEKAVYREIPHDGDQILLEIPFYYNDPNKNIVYMYNQRWHHHPILNGKSTWPPVEYMSDVNHILTPRQINFPTEQKLRLLIQDYSVTCIIFHWKRLTEELPDKGAIKKMRERVRRMKRFGRVIHDTESQTVLKTQEFFPIKRLNRNFAMYHLKKYPLVIHLSAPYSGGIKVHLNNRFLLKKEVDGQKITVDLRSRPLESAGNPVSIIFDKPVILERINWNSGK
jgi:hypothetical protein